MLPWAFVIGLAIFWNPWA